MSCGHIVLHYDGNLKVHIWSYDVALQWESKRLVWGLFSTQQSLMWATHPFAYISIAIPKVRAPKHTISFSFSARTAAVNLLFLPCRGISSSYQGFDLSQLFLFVLFPSLISCPHLPYATSLFAAPTCECPSVVRSWSPSWRWWAITSSKVVSSFALWVRWSFWSGFKLLILLRLLKLYTSSRKMRAVEWRAKALLQCSSIWAC